MESLRQKLLTGCGILDSEGIMDELGHFSVKIPGEDRVLINGKVSPGQATDKDLVLLDFDGNKIEGTLEPAKEIPLHLCVYRKRKDVMAIAHTHSPMIVALSTAGVSLRAIENLGATVYGVGAVPVYDGCGLVDTFETGDAIVEALGSKNIIVLKGHGNLVAGESIEEACISAIWAEKAAVAQYRALNIGGPEYFPSEEIEKTRGQVVAGKAFERAWNYYKWRSLRSD